MTPEEQLAWNNVKNFEDMWLEPIFDEYKDQIVSTHRITQIINECGWQFWMDEHTEGVYKERSVKGVTTEWCGFSAAWAMLQGGWIFDGMNEGHVYLALNPAIAKYVMPSTERLASEAKWEQASEKSWEAGNGAFDPFEEIHHSRRMLPGDIVVVGDRKLYGDHITMCVGLVGKYPNDNWISIEGNAHGQLGNNEYGEGVVRRTRTFGKVTKIYRPKLEHFVKII